MFDARLRPLIDPPLNRIARALAGTGMRANHLTWLGFVVGLGGALLVAHGAFLYGLVLILFNRLFDGLDGALARQLGPTDLGGYLDIVLDFIFYSAVVFGFVWADPKNAVAGAFLIFSFIGTGSSFLAFAIFAERRSLRTDAQGQKSLYYLAGLAEGFETLLVLVLFCVLPAAFVPIALFFAGLCWVSTAMRVYLAAVQLSD